MTPTFLDTSFLLALLLTDDAHHERAIAWQKAVRGGLLTTEYVLVELADALVSEHLRVKTSPVIRALKSDPAVQIVGADTGLMDRGMELYATRTDKRWSLTDCISFVAMRDAGAVDALTSDHHFEQAGFRALLRHKPD